MEVTDAPPAMMEVDSTILERVDKVCTNNFKVVRLKSHSQAEKVATNDEAQYQPPSDLEPGQVFPAFKLLPNTSANTDANIIETVHRSDFQVEATITELKPVKQNVTYDTSTGKMYAELGASTPCPAPPSVTAPNNQPYFQSYQAPTSAYSPYPTAASQMQAPSVQYSSAYSTTTYTSLAPYDRFSATTYPFSTPGAILPHSAINLSVKTEEASGQTAELSPQILDLTRPLRYRRSPPAVQCSWGNNLGNSFEYPPAICPSSIFPSCFTAFIFLTLLVLVID